jgi:hypothetical protein
MASNRAPRTATPIAGREISDLAARGEGPKIEALPWTKARELLGRAQTYWFATTHPSARPHVRPVLAVLVGDALYTTTNPSARKARNIGYIPACSLSTTLEGFDFVYQGYARVGTDTKLLEEVAGAYVDKYGWPATVRNGSFDAPYGAPTAGPPPYVVLAVEPQTVFAFGTDEKTAPRSTRWLF